MIDEITVYEEKEQALSLVETAKNIKIKTMFDFSFANDLSGSLKKAENGIKKYWNDAVKDAKTAYDRVRNLRDADLKPVQYARKEIDTLAGQWKAEEDRKTRIKQEELERKAKEKADQQRQKLIEKAEAEKDEKKKKRLFEKADFIVQEPVFAEKTIEKTTALSGGGTRTWIKDIEVKVDNIKEVCKAVVDDNIPVTCVEFKNLKAWAKVIGYKNINIYGLSIKEISRPSTRA